ncbi:MAG: hypothetical protein IKD08_04465 [Alphaproteobacteria bacterium]|nr:hypothetical protein [Alphaproteobacteria bacterium]
MLKNATTEYIEENKESITVGTTLLEPTDVGVDIDGYKIGIRKEDDGTINAMIAASGGGNDIKAAKVASLLGVSAGIYSAQDTAKAWGINGIWAEDVSNYGFTSLPTGVPVVTTTYDKDTSAGINEEQLKEIVENTSFERLTAKTLCIDNPDIPEEERCISEWNIASFNPIELISQCTADKAAGVTNSTACAKAWEKNLNRSCSDIAMKYKGAGFNASSGIFAITTSATTQVERACYFVNGVLPTNSQLIEAAKTDAIARRYDWENSKITANCSKIISSWSSAPTAFYSFVTGESSYNANQPCVFTGSRVATYAEVISQCNASSDGTFASCRYGWINDINRSCNSIIEIDASRDKTSNFVTTNTSGRIQLCIKGGESALLNNGETWVRSTEPKTYWETETFCSNIGMKLQSRAAIQAAGLWNSGSNPFSVAYWHWTTDLWENNSDYGWSVWFGTSKQNADYRNSNYDKLMGDTSGTYYIYALCAPNAQANPSDALGAISGGECQEINGKAWIQSSGMKTYWESETFCNNIGMKLQSRTAIQAAGLWNPGSSNPFNSSWVWSTDVYNNNTDYGWLVKLGTSDTEEYKRNTNYVSNSFHFYALCGPK